MGAQKLKPIPTHPHPNMVAFFSFLILFFSLFLLLKSLLFRRLLILLFLLLFCSSAEARLEVAEVADLVFSCEVL